MSGPIRLHLREEVGLEDALGFAEAVLTQRRKDAKAQRKPLETRQRFAPLRLCVRIFFLYSSATRKGGRHKPCPNKRP
jgi:hypothetical protein